MRLLALCMALFLLAGCGAQEPVQTTQPVQTTVDTTPPMPDFTVYDQEGNAHMLSEFRGKPVILNFWASWCGPCVGEMPEFEKAYQQYGQQIHFLMVNLTDGQAETVEKAASFIAQQGYSFPLYFDTTGQASYTYGISAIPRTFFLDARGVYVTDATGMMSEESLQQAINLILE